MTPDKYDHMGATGVVLRAADTAEQMKNRATVAEQRELESARLAANWAVQDFVRALNHLNRLGISVEPDGAHRSGLFELTWGHGKRIRYVDVTWKESEDIWVSGSFE